MVTPDRLPYRQRSLEEVAEDVLELRRDFQDLANRLDMAPFVRVDLHAEQLDRVRSDVAAVRSLTMWTLGILCTSIVGAIVVLIVNASQAAS